MTVLDVYRVCFASFLLLLLLDTVSDLGWEETSRFLRRLMALTYAVSALVVLWAALSGRGTDHTLGLCPPGTFASLQGGR